MRRLQQQLAAAVVCWRIELSWKGSSASRAQRSGKRKVRETARRPTARHGILEDDCLLLLLLLLVVRLLMLMMVAVCMCVRARCLFVTSY